jgi:circadian clock protein KaiB
MPHAGRRPAAIHAHRAPRTSARAKTESAANGGETYAFRLFVAGTEPNSTTARHNLTRLCEQYLPGRHRIDIVDVFESAALALKHHVLVTPTLIVLKPRLGVTLLGNLSETRQVLATLRLNGHGR